MFVEKGLLILAVSILILVIRDEYREFKAWIKQERRWKKLHR